MRAVVQRVKNARVFVDREITGEIDSGILILLGIKKGDNEETARWIAEKCVNLRIFENDEGKFHFSLIDTKGDVLVVSQFTLYGDCRKGRRPSFTDAADPEDAGKIYNYFVNILKEMGIKVRTGIFGAHMDVELVNDGPVTLILEQE